MISGGDGFAAQRVTSLAVGHAAYCTVSIPQKVNWFGDTDQIEGITPGWIEGKNITGNDNCQAASRLRDVDGCTIGPGVFSSIALGVVHGGVR